jgi:hypothetical protein
MPIGRSFVLSLFVYRLTQARRSAAPDADGATQQYDTVHEPASAAVYSTAALKRE